MDNLISLKNNEMIVSHFRVERIGLVPLGTPSFDEWKECGMYLSRLHTSMHWVVGDWLAFGEATYGTLYEQALDETGFEYQTLRNDKWVCSRIPLSRRRDNLSFEHHKEVASFPPDQQEYLLSLAETRALPVSRLRREKYSLLMEQQASLEERQTSLAEKEKAEQEEQLPLSPPASHHPPFSFHESEKAAPLLPDSGKEQGSETVPRLPSATAVSSWPALPAAARTSEVPVGSSEQTLNTQVAYNRLYHGDASTVLKTFPGECIDTVMTSPPYWALRDYGREEQLGLEPTIAEYLDHLCAIFDEIKRVLKPTGTCFVNIGDTYGSGMGGGLRQSIQGTNRGTQAYAIMHEQGRPATAGLEKSLCCIPFRFAVAMVSRGWILRNLIIWHKPNAMPESVTDRFTNDFDYLFFFVKEKTYYFEKQFEEPRESPKATFAEYEEYKRLNRLVSADRQETHVKRSQNVHGHFSHPLGRNMRTVWTIPTHSSCEPHYSTYPEALCETPIRAGCPLYICKACHTPARRMYDAEPQKPHPYHYASKYQEGMNAERLNAKRESIRANAREKAKELFPDDREEQQAYMRYTHNHEIREYAETWTSCDCGADWYPGVVLDPFIGTATTAVVAKKLGRRYIGIDINVDYIRIAEERLSRIGGDPDLNGADRNAGQEQTG